MARKEKAGLPATMGEWDKELAEFARTETARASAVAGAGQFVSIQGGRFGFQGEDLGTELDVIVLAFAFDYSYYTGAYDPQNPTSPVCWSIGLDARAMVAPEDVPDRQSSTCGECWANQFASREGGRGKACKNSIRVALVSATDTDAIKGGTANVAFLRLPPTSMKAWGAYVTKLNGGLKKPPFGVVTRFRMVPRGAFSIPQAELVDVVKDVALMKPIIDLRASVLGNGTPGNLLDDSGYRFSSDDGDTSAGRKPMSRAPARGGKKAAPTPAPTPRGRQLRPSSGAVAAAGGKKF